MDAKAILTVKGVQYYLGAQLLQSGKLKVGMAVCLVREPDNPFDANAVAVHMASTDEMLGHLSRTSAPKYTHLIQSGRIKSTVIEKLIKNGSAIYIDIQIHYEIDDAIIQKSQFAVSISKIQSAPGVYSIRNTKSNRRYVGSSIDMKKRLREHLSKLIDRVHHNRRLRADFVTHGVECFEATVLEFVLSPAALLSAEERQIAHLNNSGVWLYNSTVDGQGIRPTRPGSSTFDIPVASDSLWAGTYIFVSHEEIRKTPNLSVADLVEIRATLHKYCQEKVIAEAHNLRVLTRTKIDDEREENAGVSKLRIKNDRIANYLKQIKELAKRIDANRVNFIASLWTICFEYSHRSRSGEVHTVRLKKTPSNRKLAEDHRNAVRNLDTLENQALTLYEQSKAELIDLPNDKASMNLSVGKAVLNLSKLDIVVLEQLIRERSV